MPARPWTALPSPGTQRRLALIAAAGLAVIAVLIPTYRLQNLSWLEAIASAIVFVIPAMVLGRLVWQRTLLQSDDRRWPRALASHLLRALAFSIAWTGLNVSFVYLIRPDALAGFLRDAAVWQFAWGLVIYAAVVQAANLQRRLREREAAAASAELQALRAQLNPHFLFNTLHALTQLAHEDPAATAAALECFGDLLRYVLSAGRDAGADVSLEEELGFVRNYLALEQLRLGDRLRVMEQIDANTLELAVPPLLLQPLVENAVRHGVAPRRRGGTVWLTARDQGGALIVEVADDGPGAVPGVWHTAGGLGLRAVQRQLQARFPRAGCMEIHTAPDAGFLVRVTAPAQIPRRSQA